MRFEITGCATDVFTLAQIQTALRAGGAKRVRRLTAAEVLGDNERRDYRCNPASIALEHAKEVFSLELDAMRRAGL